MAQQQMQVDFTQVINELANRLRILEGKQSVAAEKMLVMNQNMIAEYKKLLGQMKAVNQSLGEMQKDVDKVKNVIKHLSEEAGQFARENDVKVLEKYIKLWDPLKFVTEEEVEAIIAKHLNSAREQNGRRNPRQRSARTPQQKDEQGGDHAELGGERLHPSANRRWDKSSPD